MIRPETAVRDIDRNSVAFGFLFDKMIFAGTAPAC